MSATSLAAFEPSPFESVRIRRGTLFYLLCLTAISTGYYVYWWLWKLKAYFVGWGICLAIAGAMLLAGHLRARRVLRDMVPILVWHAFLFASALWSPSPATTLYYAGVALVNVMAFLVSYAWFKSTSDWELSGFFELQALLVVPIALWFLLTIGQFYNENLGAVRTGFATNCLVAIPFLIWRVRIHPGMKSVTLLLFALAIILTGDSRSGILIVPILIIGALFFVKQSGFIRAPSVGVPLLLLSVFVLLVVFVPPLREGFGHSLGRLAPSGTRLSVSSSVLDEVAGPMDAQVDIERRLQLFVALQSFLNHPLLGGGYQSTYAMIQHQFGMEVSAHGLPSTLLGETGLLGTAIFAWMISRFFRRINRVAVTTPASMQSGFWSTCKLTMLGILLLGLFQQTDQGQALFVLLAWGYAAGPPSTTAVA